MPETVPASELKRKKREAAIERGVERGERRSVFTLGSLSAVSRCHYFFTVHCGFTLVLSAAKAHFFKSNFIIRQLCQP